MKKLNIIFSVILIVFSAGFFYYAGTFRTLPNQQDIGPAAFPRLISILLILCSILLILTEIRRKEEEKLSLFNVKLLIGFGAVVAYFLLLNPLGFLLDSAVIVLVMMLLLLNEPLKKAWPLLASVSIAVPVALYAIFAVFLKVPLPTGILSFLAP